MISILPPHVAALIAAGEVIHSPRDVLKELIENALDAGATEIVVTLKYGGIEHIGVSDNGAGLTKADLLLAPQRHATSKIQSAEDLLSLRSFGFRGEGLYSIAAVSNFTMSSRQESASIGSKLTIVLPDREPLITDCARNVGTTVQCDHLFAPIPVRRKLLKSPRIEQKRSLEMIRSLLIIHPDVRLQVSEHGEAVLILDRSANDFIGRLVQAFPLTDRNQWSFFQKPFDQGLIEGWFYPDSTKGLEQQWYMNKRWFAQGAFMKMAHRYSERGILIVSLTLRPEYVDLNLHPQKHQLGFYLQDSLLSSLSDFFMDWLGLPCADTPVAIELSPPKDSQVLYTRPSLLQRVSSADRLIDAGSVSKKAPARLSLEGGGGMQKTREKRGDLSSSSSLKTAPESRDHRQMLFLDKEHALLSDVSLVIFNPIFLLRQMIQEGGMVDLIEPFYIKSDENIAIFYQIELCDRAGRVDRVPADWDRYMLLAWLSEEKSDILRLYQLLQDSLMHFVQKYSQHNPRWITMQPCYLGSRTLQDLLPQGLERGGL